MDWTVTIELSVTLPLTEDETDALHGYFTEADVFLITGHSWSSGDLTLRFGLEAATVWDAAATAITLAHGGMTETGRAAHPLSLQVSQPDPQDTAAAARIMGDLSDPASA